MFDKIVRGVMNYMVIAISEQGPFTTLRRRPEDESRDFSIDELVDGLLKVHRWEDAVFVHIRRKDQHEVLIFKNRAVYATFHCVIPTEIEERS